VSLPPEKAREAIQDFCDGYAAKKQYRTAHLYLNYLRSLLKHNGKKDLELEDVYAWKRSKRPERVPTRDEVYRMAEASDLRDKALLLCDFQSGLRNATLRALTYGDIKDQIESDEPSICLHVTPRLKERVAEACKENVEQFTFFGKKASEALRLYLEERKRRYGAIGDEEPLFRSHSNIPDAAARSQPITEDALQRLVKKAARKAGIKEWKDVRFHSLRKTFKVVLDAGFVGGGGQLAEDDKEYLMGHVLPSQKAPYHTANVQVLQERYSKLDWGGEPTNPEEAAKRAVMAMIKAQYGDRLPPEKLGELERILPMTTTADETAKRMMSLLVTTSEEDEPATRSQTRKHRMVRTKTARNGGTARFETRIVSEEELVELLNEGWDIVKELSGGKIVVRRPNE
jgi:integrase